MMGRTPDGRRDEMWDSLICACLRSSSTVERGLLYWFLDLFLSCFISFLLYFFLDLFLSCFISFLIYFFLALFLSCFISFLLNFFLALFLFALFLSCFISFLLYFFLALFLSCFISFLLYFFLALFLYFCIALFLYFFLSFFLSFCISVFLYLCHLLCLFKHVLSLETERNGSMIYVKMLLKYVIYSHLESKVKSANWMHERRKKWKSIKIRLYRIPRTLWMSYAPQDGRDSDVIWVARTWRKRAGHRW